MAEQEDSSLKEVALNLNKKPTKGILKNSSSFETSESTKWYLHIWYIRVFLYRVSS